jgi:hypothetical protein
MGKRDRTASCLFGLIVVPAFALGALYWTYCWGWWGQHRLLQLLFECSCPAASEEARYPERVDVLFPACAAPWVSSSSPSGRYTLVALKNSSYHSYLYDQKTGKLTPNPFPGVVYFLNDEWALLIEHFTNHAERDNYYIYDIGGRKLVQLNKVQLTENHAVVDPGELEAFRMADQVYLMGGSAIALAKDFAQHLEANFILGGAGTSREEIRKILSEHGINLPDNSALDPLHEFVSHNGLFKYNFGNIDLVAEKRTIREGYEGYSFYGQWWAYEDRGVVLESTQTIYLVGEEASIFINPKFFPIPQPILLLKVPKEYLSPAARQAEEAHEAQEQAAKRQAAIEFWVVVAIVIAALMLNFIRTRKKN